MVIKAEFEVQFRLLGLSVSQDGEEAVVSGRLIHAGNEATFGFVSREQGQSAWSTFAPHAGLQLNAFGTSDEAAAWLLAAFQDKRAAL